MLENALKFCVDLVRKSNNMKTLLLPDSRLMVAKPDGSVELFAAPFEVVKDNLYQIDSLLRWIALQDNAVDVFVAGAEIVAICGRDSLSANDLRRASMFFKYSSAFAALRKLCEIQNTQRDIIRALRGPLAGCYAPGMVNYFRALEFRKNVESQATIRNGADSLGKSIVREARVGPNVEVIESISFTLPVFDTPGLAKQIVEIGVDVNLDTERVEFFPVGDSLDNAERASCLELVSILERFAMENEKLGLRVYLGQPKA